MKIFAKYGLDVPDILLPKDQSDLAAWAVIACDQYTQDKNYWQRAAKLTENKASALNMILPEIYLADADVHERIKKIHLTMADYLDKAVFADPIKSLIYIERKTTYGRLRKGLITAIDLESYDWQAFSKANIRSTEATILERIPPRVFIRKNAPLEIPHIMLLANDQSCRLVEQTGQFAKDKKNPLYSTDLMLNGGQIQGWLVPQNDETFQHILFALNNLAAENTAKDGAVFLFAVGDGNHSLAAAKTVWDDLKLASGGIRKKNGSISIPQKLKNSALRYALVEIVNIYDSGLNFEPIHRVLYGLPAAALCSFLKNELNSDFIECENAEELKKNIQNKKTALGLIFAADTPKKSTAAKKNLKYLLMEISADGLLISALQPALDKFLQKTGNIAATSIDYIHGNDEAFRLAQKSSALVVLLPPIDKHSFFKTISDSGPLPRKSFSMGEADEKRFYMECRQL